MTELAGAVGYGHRTTHAALAAGIEWPCAARAVGAALGANPLGVVCPTTGWSPPAAPRGLAAKGTSWRWRHQGWTGTVLPIGL